ncbi:unnamed protein product [Lactuca saligna]|uniref:Uncharacterized protein n=1 Tax=Lactuca saligna TaxID=75948 RepID=A0AA35ZLX4_LACSI|nr:unnamed protein product [Lactuca saligna]
MVVVVGGAGTVMAAVVMLLFPATGKGTFGPWFPLVEKANHERSSDREGSVVEDPLRRRAPLVPYWKVRRWGIKRGLPVSDFCSGETPTSVVLISLVERERMFGLFLVFTGVFVGLALDRSSMRRRSIMVAGSLFFWPVVNRGKEGGQHCSHRTRGGVLVAPIERKVGRREVVASLFSLGINTPRCVSEQPM